MRGGPGGRCFKNARLQLKVPSIFRGFAHLFCRGTGQIRSRCFSKRCSWESRRLRMFRTPATVIGLAGAAFLAGGLAPNAFSTASMAKSEPALDRAALRQQVQASAKADRLQGPVAAQDRLTVSVVEVVGV